MYDRKKIRLPQNVTDVSFFVVMKDIVTNKRKIPEAEISTMLANYTFKGGIPKKLGDPAVPTIPCSKFLWYSTLKSIISKHGGNFSFRYLSFICNDILHVLSIRIYFQHIS